MSSTSPEGTDRLTVAQRAMLDAIFGVLASSRDWPTYQYLDSRRWGPALEQPGEVYASLSGLGLVRASTPLREDTPVVITPRGLGEVTGGAEVLDVFLRCIRYLGVQAREFVPIDPTIASSLVVSSEQIALGLEMEPLDPAIALVGRFVQQTNLWTAFGGPGDEGWSVTVNLARARPYAEVLTLDDYLSVQAGEGLQGASQAPPSAAKPTEPSSPTKSEEPMRFARSVATDLPTGEDLLGYRPLVKALHGLLNDPRTALPLAIAINAPWGAGKSSVMAQLETALCTPSEGDAQRTWATVRFDAWKYERSERMWAALAKAIYSQPQRQMAWWDRIWFRVRLEWERRGPLGSALTLLWPLAALGAIVLAALQVHWSSAAAIPASLGAAALTLGLVTHYAHALANPFKAAIERYARRPDYESQLGFTAEADHDIRVMTRLLAPDDSHGLAVFVDDLDRCSSAHLVEVVEAMNQIFNSTPEHRCAFILGLDRDIVATNINVAYANTVAELAHVDGNGLGASFGYEFLAKLVQLSVTIPEPTPGALQVLLAKITGNAPPLEDTGTPTPAQPDVERVREGIQASAGESLSDVGQAAAAVTDAPQAVVAEAVRREVAERLEDSPEVAAAEQAAVGLLDRNPRQLKRFHNAFRLQLYVANEDESVPFAFTQDELVALTKWVVVRLRWPDLGHAIAHDPALLLVIEADANGELHTLPTGVTQPRTERSNQWLDRQGVRALMVEAGATRRMSALELKAFLRVA